MKKESLRLLTSNFSFAQDPTISKFRSKIRLVDISRFSTFSETNPAKKLRNGRTFFGPLQKKNTLPFRNFLVRFVLDPRRAAIASGGDFS